MRAAPWTGRRSGVVVFSWMAVSAAVLVAGCGAEARPAESGSAGSSRSAPPGPVFAADEPAPPATFDEVFEIVERITLEENDEVVIVQPFVTVDDAGRFVLAEPRESQVRVYAPDGRLERIVGRRGEGPGEMMMPTAARMAPDGRVIVGDVGTARVTIYSADGEGAPETLASPIAMPSDLRALAEGGYLVVGVDPTRSGDPLLHVWDGTEDGLRSFFPMPVAEKDRGMALSTAYVHTAMTGDTIWAVFSLNDTIYRFGPDGTDRGRIVVPTAASPSLPVMEGERQADFIEALEAVTRVFNLFVLDDGTLAVQVARNRGAAVDFGLVLLERDGRGIAEMKEAPRLMGVHGDRFYFQDPASDLPNEWVAARRRSAS